MVMLQARIRALTSADATAGRLAARTRLGRLGGGNRVNYRARSAWVGGCVNAEQ